MNKYIERKNPIYKYTKIKHVIDSIKYGIYASKIKELNDPYEYYEVLNKDNFIICCLTKSNNSKLMWSHYGDSHKGCMLKIDTQDSYLKENNVLKNVNYDSKYISRMNKSDLEIVENLYIKDKKWSGEKEVRAVANIYCLDEKVWQNVNDKYYFKAKIKEVVFGCSVEKNDEYLELLKEIKSYNESQKYKKDKIAVRKMKMHDSFFRFVYDKEYDYLKEIQQINIVIT